MSGVAVAVLALVVVALGVAAFGPDLLRAARRANAARAARERRRARERAAWEIPDPGAALRAERRAEELLRSVVGAEAYRAYEALGVLYCPLPAAAGRASYGYLIYPHKPVVSFDERSGELLNEHCVAFPDRTLPKHLQRLPAADDVLAKWLSLRADEHRLIDAANMHLPGRQLDPERVRRDLARLGEWTGRQPADTALANGRRAA